MTILLIQWLNYLRKILNWKESIDYFIKKKTLILSVFLFTLQTQMKHQERSYRKRIHHTAFLPLVP